MGTRKGVKISMSTWAPCCCLQPRWPESFEAGMNNDCTLSHYRQKPDVSGYYFHIYLRWAFIFPSQSLRAVISVPLPLSSYAIISSSCTFSIVHCLTEELELSKEKTDYLLFSKITTRLFPLLWPGPCLGNKQQCLLFFSLPRILCMLNELLITLEGFSFGGNTHFFSLSGVIMLYFPYGSGGKGLNLPQMVFHKLVWCFVVVL